MTDIADLEGFESILAVVRQPRPRSTSIEDRLELLEDQAEIADMVLRYAWLCDGRRWDEIWSMYTDDFSRRVDNAPSENVDGLDAVIARYLPLLDRDDAERWRGTPHEFQVRNIAAPPLVRVSADRTGAGAVTAYELLGDDFGKPVRRTVLYRWGLRRSDDDQWRFCDLTVTARATSPDAVE